MTSILDKDISYNTGSRSKFPIPKKNLSREKAAEERQAELEKQKDEFFKNGGKIEIIETGVSGIAYAARKKGAVSDKGMYNPYPLPHIDPVKVKNRI